jgi:hypothetical protein
MGQSLGQWDFDAGTLAASGGATLGALTYADANTTSQTAFGTTTSFGIPNINGSPANVMRFPIATNGMGYLMPTPPGANGGGSTVNEWTMILDVLYPAASDVVIRPIIDTDGAVFVPGPDIVISDTDGIGPTPSGPFNGSIQPNVWYRVGIVVTASEVDYYINGSQVGTTSGAGLDGRFALSLSTTALILGSTANNAGLGYVNSIQLRDSALNGGQMLALGSPVASGIPTTIPPVPSFIQTRSPAVNATGIYPLPPVHVVLNQGDTTVTSGSIQLLYDGVAMTETVVPTPPTFDITATNNSIQDPNSIHTLSLIYTDSTGNKTNSWSFTVANYQNINLPAPFYLENFDELTENTSGPTPVPTGWSVANQTWPGNAGFSLDDLNSDTYKDWVLVTAAREASWGAAFGEPDDRTALPPIVLNGQLLTLSTFLSGNLMWEETDQRCGSCWGQYQEMYTGDISCTGRTNVYVAFKSFYEQNQDNMNLVEYSVNQGASWLPVRYLFCTTGNGETSDIIYTNDAGGHPVIDVGQTFSRVDPSRGWAPWGPGCDYPATCPVHGTNYGLYLKAPISTALIPYIFGYTNDDTRSSKEIIVVRLPQADGQAKVRFRFLGDGTSSWFWGIDDFGLYEINTPTITGQPANQKVSAGSTATFTVAASSPTALTYRWRHAGTNLNNGGHFSGVTTTTLTVSNCETNDAGAYVCAVSNPFGTVNSSIAQLTVVTAPEIETQPVTVVSSINFPASLSVVAMGRPPLVYQWTKEGAPVGANSSALNFPAVQLSDAAHYQVTITNSEGSAVSVLVRLIVSPADINSNLVVHLKFDGDYNDSSGHGNNASAVAGGSAPDSGPSLVAGKIGQALRFTTARDGSVIDYATLGYPVDLKFGNTVDFSISFWCNYTSSVDDPPFISNKNWDSSGNRGWGIFTQDNGHFRANVTGTGGTKYDLGSGSTPLVRDGVWHNIVLSYARGAIVTTYVDGNPIDTRADTTTGNIDTDDLSYAVNVGQDGRGIYTDGGSAGITNCLIDDVGIWRRALSGAEAKGIYVAGQAGKDLSQAQGATLGSLTVVVSGANVNFSWAGGTGIRLQRSTSLSPAAWTDVTGTLGNSSYSEPKSSFPQAYYRLYKP